METRAKRWCYHHVKGLGIIETSGKRRPSPVPLEKNWKRPTQEGLTACRLLERLQTKGGKGVFDSIQRFVTVWR